MKLNRQTTEVTRGGVSTESTFTIATSAHAFEILSSGLYTDSVAAIVRELSCNAYDAHVMAGNKETPFDIHVPSKMEPWFAIRDYGTGLSKEDVTGIYTTYFQSTKSNSDDFIGALGLGSKSPFSYSSEFQVTSYFEGVSYKYAIFLNEQGVPSVALMGEAVTTEPNGLEVRLPSEDRRRFAQAIGQYLAYFKVKPTILGTIDSDVTDLYNAERLPSGSELDSEGEWFIAGKDTSYYSSRVGLVYGQVPYPANVDRITEGLEDICSAAALEFYKNFSNRLVFIFNVGELSITANREELKYDADTLKSIGARITAFHAKFFAGVNKAIEEFADNDSLYKTNRYLMESVFGNESQFFGAIDFSQINCEAFAVLQNRKSRWGRNYQYAVDDAIADAEVTLHEVSYLETYYSQVVDAEKVRAAKGKSVDCLGISNPVVYYVVDEKRFGPQKAKQHFQKNEKNGTRYMMIKAKNLADLNGPMHVTELNDFKIALGNPDFILTSTLEYEAPVRKTRTASAKQLGTVFNCGPHWTVKSELDLEAGGIYIYLAGGTKMYKGSKAVWENDIFRSCQHSSAVIQQMVAVYNEVHGTDFLQSDLIGVSAADIKSFDKDEEWHNITDTVDTYVKANQVEMHRAWQEYTSFTGSVQAIGHETSRNFFSMFKGMADMIGAGKKSFSIIETIGTDSDFYALMVKYLGLNIKRHSLAKAIEGYDPLLGAFGDRDYRTVSALDNRYTFSIDSELEALCKKYTLLSLMERYYADTSELDVLQSIVEYIIMIDNKPTTDNRD